MCPILHSMLRSWSLKPVSLLQLDTWWGHLNGLQHKDMGCTRKKRKEDMGCTSKKEKSPISCVNNILMTSGWPLRLSDKHWPLVSSSSTVIRGRFWPAPEEGMTAAKKPLYGDWKPWGLKGVQQRPYIRRRCTPIHPLCDCLSGHPLSQLLGGAAGDP